MSNNTFSLGTPSRHLHRHQYVCEYCTHTIHKNEEALKQAMGKYNINEEGSHVLTAMCNGKLLHFDATCC